MPAVAARTAVILNANAKRVTPRKARQLARLCRNADVYFSHSLAEAEEISATVVARGYDRVLAGGGDGTLVRVLNSLCQRLDLSDTAYPQLGILKLGTGNAVASHVQARSAEEDILSLVSEPHLKVVPLALIHSHEDGLDFPFAGIGYDGEILNDYLWLKNNLKGPFVEDLTHSVAGYFAALALRTLPRKLTEGDPPRVTIRSMGRAIYRDPLDGDAMREIPAGSVLYQGPAAMVSASTVPFYGYNFRMFPFSQDVPDMMQLRVVTIAPWTILNNLPAIWQGTHRDVGVLDFHVEHVTVDGEAPLPFQIGGDAWGYRSKLEFSMSPRRIDLVSPEAANQD